MTPERRRCGVPCLTHTHSCDRSPNHTGTHRDVQQKGNHTCEWDTPGAKDVPALIAEVKRLKSALSEACEQVAEADDRMATAEVRAAAAEARVRELEAAPVDWDAQRRRADELEAERDRLRGELEKARAAEQGVRKLIAYLGRRHDLEATLTTGDIGRLITDLEAALDGTEGQS